MSITDASNTEKPCAGNLKREGTTALQCPKSIKIFSLDPQASRLYTPRKPRFLDVTSGGHVYEAEFEAV